MLNRRGKVENIDPDSFLMIIILIIGFLVLYSTSNNSSNRNNDPGPAVTLKVQSSATVANEIQLTCLQKSWIFNKDNFKLLSFDKTQFLENKKIDQKITLLDIIQLSSVMIPDFFVRYHLFPFERDELPVLS